MAYCRRGMIGQWHERPKAKQPNAPAAPPGTYVEWRKHVAALLERQGISSTVMRERAWRNLFIRNATPEEAAYRAAIEAHNMP